MASICLARPVQMDTLGIEPRAFRMRSGCDTTTPCALIGPVCALCSCGRGSVARAPRVAFWEGVVRRRGGAGGARSAHAGYSSVGRASDGRRLQQSDGPWFDSGWPDSLRHALCGLHSIARAGHSLAAFLVCPLRWSSSCPPACVRVQVPVAWLRACGCAGVETPPAGLEPAIFGLEVRRLVH